MNEKPKSSLEPVKEYIKHLEDSVTPSVKADVVRGFRADLESGASADVAKLIAKYTMIKYRAYIAAGFDESQSLYLAGK